MWLDAKYLKVREAGRVVSIAVLIATGVAATGKRRALGFELSPGNDEGSAWPRFIRVGMIIAEQDDELQDGRRCFRPETMALIDAVRPEEVAPALLMAS